MGCVCSGSSRSLSQADIDFLKRNTRYDEETIREWHEGFMQDCPSGKLYPKTFVDMYKMFFPAGNAEAFCRNVFRTFDKDRSGYIDFREFLVAMDITSCGTAKEKLQWAFSFFELPEPNEAGKRQRTVLDNNAKEIMEITRTVTQSFLPPTVATLPITHGHLAAEYAQPPKEERPFRPPARRRGPTEPYQDFSASSIAAARSSYLDFTSGCQKVVAHMLLLREDVRQLTQVAMDIVGMPSDTSLPTTAQPVSLPFSLPCVSLHELNALELLACHAVGKAAVRTAARAASRGATIHAFHKKALHGIMSDEVLSHFYIAELGDVACPYGKRDREPFPVNILAEYENYCSRRCADIMEREQQIAFWFSAFAEVEAASRRKDTLEHARCGD